MIIVTGATGQLGQAIVEQLVARVPANQVGVSVRDPGKAAHLEALGVRVRQGDFDKPASLVSSFEGAKQVLIVSSDARASGGDPLVQHRSAIEAAKAAGVQRLVYTSQMAASHSSAFPPARDHAATEDILRESGLAWTSLRHGFYAASGIMLMGDALKSRLIEAPADGKVAWTVHADLAECAAIILVNKGMYEGPTPPLTGAQALDLSDLAELASELLGSPVRRQILTDDELRTKMASRGLPDRVVTMMLGLYIASRNGEFASVNPTLERILGRPPVAMHQVLMDRIKTSH